MPCFRWTPSWFEPEFACSAAYSAKSTEAQAPAHRSCILAQNAGEFLRLALSH